MFCLMLLLFGAVVFISGTDPKKLKDFINYCCPLKLFEPKN